jgi:hypothetical protein
MFLNLTSTFAVRRQQSRIYSCLSDGSAEEDPLPALRHLLIYSYPSTFLCGFMEDEVYVSLLKILRLQ